MKMWGDRQGGSLRRGASGAALMLAGLLAVVLLIVGTGSMVIQALSPSDPISVTKDVIPFGVVLPGEDYPDDFVICIKDPEAGDHVDYTLTLTVKPLDPGPGNFPDMRPFLTMEADDPTETDPLADGPAGDYEAAGELDEGTSDDECDTWLVTLTAPHCEDFYNQFTDPQGSGATIPCQVDKGTSPDPQTWITGSALGAEVEINSTSR